MPRSLRFAASALLMLLAAGCASDSEYSKRKRETDELWRAGYGFNNPNAERLKEGKPPLDFDGREHRTSFLDILFGE